MEKKELKKKKMPRWKRILRYRCWRLSKSMRINERVEAANSWAKKNPKLFFGSVLSVLLLCTVVSIIAFIASFYIPDSGDRTSKGSDTEIMSGVESIQPIMNGFHKIENGKKRENQEINALIDRGMSIKKELDSLRNLEYKTHDDSVLMIQDYHQLESIVNFLNKRQQK